jgi:hypothetical protein
MRKYNRDQVHGGTITSARSEKHFIHFSVEFPIRSLIAVLHTATHFPGLSDCAESHRKDNNNTRRILHFALLFGLPLKVSTLNRAQSAEALSASITVF